MMATMAITTLVIAVAFILILIFAPRLLVTFWKVIIAPLLKKKVATTAKDAAINRVQKKAEKILDRAAHASELQTQLNTEKERRSPENVSAKLPKILEISNVCLEEFLAHHTCAIFNFP